MQAGVDCVVARVIEDGFAEEGFGPGVLEGLPRGEGAGEEGMDFGGGVPDAGLDVKDGDSGFAGFREAGAAEEFYGQGVGLGVVGTDKGQDGGFAGS